MSLLENKSGFYIREWKKLNHNMNVYFSENRKRRSSQESKLSEEVMGKSKIGPYAVFVHEQVTT